MTQSINVKHVLIEVFVPLSLHSYAKFVPVFNGLNFPNWKHVDIIDASNIEGKTHYRVWKRSSRLSMMFMLMSITSNIKFVLPKTESAKEFMKFVEERSQAVDKSLAGTLIITLTTMKFDGSRTIHEHVIEMKNIVRLKSLGMVVDENFLVQFILNSLTFEYDHFQMNYNTMKDKWNVHELHNMLVQEEARLKNQGNYSINYVYNQEVGKKLYKKHGKAKRPLKINDSFTKFHKKIDKCHFYGKFEHFQKDCLKRKAWFEKKCKHNAYYVYFESNLTEVPHNSWWIDSGCTTHVSNMMQ